MFCRFLDVDIISGKCLKRISLAVVSILAVDKMYSWSLHLLATEK